MSSQKQFLRFLIVGSIGFVVDTGVLQILVTVFEIGPYEGRGISFLIAVSATWLLNRHYTFRSNTHTCNMKRQWLVYVAVNAIGGGINYLTYAGCLSYFAIVRENLVIGVAAGSAVGLLVNFSANKYFVFRNKLPVADRTI